MLIPQMMKKKLNLTDLKVSSFVTSMEKGEKQTINGGRIDTKNADACKLYTLNCKTEAPQRTCGYCQPT